MMEIKEVGLREGYKTTELGNIPNNWDIKYLSDVLTVGYGKNQKEVEVVKSDIPILGTGGVIGWARKPLFEKPSVLIGRKGTIDKPRFIERPFWTIDTLFYTDIDTNKAFPKFIYYLFQTIDWYKYNEATGVPSLSAKNISNIKFICMSLNEQKKVAYILSAVDEQIENVEKLIEKTKELKKGLMQQLLAKGIGHTKFKETEIGEIPNVWSVTDIENIVQKIVGGGTPSRDKTEYYNGEIPWFTVKDMDGSFLKEDSQEYITDIAVKESSSNIIEKNNVIIATRIALGRGFINTKEISINQDLKALYLKKEKIIPSYFLYWYLSQNDFIESQGSGSTVKGIRLEQLRQFKLPLPPIDEQQKIASILLTVDEQIQSYKQEKDKYKALKKGLMQQLLTGQLRVKV